MTDRAAVQEFIDYMTAQGHVGVDTSRIYCDGTSEEVRKLTHLLDLHV